MIKEKEFTFSWHGKSVQERREHGIGFSVRNTLLRMVEPGDKGSERHSPHLRRSRHSRQCLLSHLDIHSRTRMVFYINRTWNHPVLDILELARSTTTGSVHNSLCVTNSFFQTKPQHKVFWCPLKGMASAGRDPNLIALLSLYRLPARTTAHGVILTTLSSSARPG